MVLHKIKEKYPAFYARLVEFGWLQPTEAPTDDRSAYVREFYCILPTVRSYVPYPFIHNWRVEIPLNVTTINEVLEVPKFQNLEFEDKLKRMYL